MEITIVPYSSHDDTEALALENVCPQGGTVMLRFRRPSFHARSSVFERSTILCAKADGRVVGIAAGAIKQTRLHGRTVRALYGYDLRVHPDFRRYGTARKLSQAVIDELSPAECIYSYVAAQNTRALQFTRRNFRPQSVIDLTYLVLPVFRKRIEDHRTQEVPASIVREGYLKMNECSQLVPDDAQHLMHGHVSSLMVASGAAGGSLWTNESLLPEEIVRLPLPLRLLRGLSVPLFPLHLFPQIPAPGTKLRSLFVYNIFAHDVAGLKSFLSAANNVALVTRRTWLFILLQACDPLIGLVREGGFRFLTVPYVFLAKGADTPLPGERLFIDIRDL